jgi:hypothetical protein
MATIGSQCVTQPQLLQRTNCRLLLPQAYAAVVPGAAWMLTSSFE